MDECVAYSEYMIVVDFRGFAVSYGLYILLCLASAAMRADTAGNVCST